MTNGDTRLSLGKTKNGNAPIPVHTAVNKDQLELQKNTIEIKKTKMI